MVFYPTRRPSRATYQAQSSVAGMIVRLVLCCDIEPGIDLPEYEGRKWGRKIEGTELVLK